LSKHAGPQVNRNRNTLFENRAKLSRPGIFRGAAGISKTARKLGIFALQMAISLFRNKILAVLAVLGEQVSGLIGYA
jgi:hypothetical protein